MLVYFTAAMDMILRHDQKMQPSKEGLGLGMINKFVINNVFNNKKTIDVKAGCPIS